MKLFWNYRLTLQSFVLTSQFSKQNIMIKHIVLFRFKDKEGKEEKVKKLKTIIDDLKNKIPYVEHIEGGINISERDSAFDVALVSDFRTTDDLDAYRVHPDHQALLAYLKQFDYEVVVTDYVY